MPYTTLTGLAIRVPTRGTRNWNAIFLSANQQLIAAHRHTGDPDGLQIPTAGIEANAVDDTKIRLRNNQWLRARNAAGTGDVNIARVDSSDQVELSAPIVGVSQTLDGSYDTGGPGAGRTIAADNGAVQATGDGFESTTYRMGSIPTASTASTSHSIDLATSQVQKLTLEHSLSTLNLNNPRLGVSYILFFIQGSGGSKTVTWPASVKWPAGVAPVLSTTAGDIDIFNLIYDGTNFYGTFAFDMG